jgi:putative transposase
VSRYRLLPTAEQAVVLGEHCRHARFVWNLAVEQQLHWQPGRRGPGYNEQCAQLTAARGEHDWLAAGSQTVQQRLARAARGSHRRACTKLAIAKLKARETARRKDWVEKATTDIARRFDMIRIEALDLLAMSRTARGTVQQPGQRVAQKRSLNLSRGSCRSGWGLLAARLQHKAYGRVEQVPAAYTSKRCSACGHVAPENRKSQAVFECEACNTGPCNADVNAARNIAAGRAVTARGDLGASRSANREPQLCSPAA